MSREVTYDNAHEADVIEGTSTQGEEAPDLKGGDGMGCHAGAAEMESAARMAGKSEILDQYAKDYPQGPHDKPQSMCPAFGSLRVGLRMRRVATVLSGSAAASTASPSCRISTARAGPSGTFRSTPRRW